MWIYIENLGISLKIDVKFNGLIKFEIVSLLHYRANCSFVIEDYVAIEVFKAVLGNFAAEISPP